MPFRLSLSVTAAVLLSIMFQPAVAALGGDEASVDSDRVQMKGALRAKTTSYAYTVHEIQTPSGTTVREYMLPQGEVFAVSWRGSTKPDLRSLLGKYFDVYAENAAARAGAGHHYLQIARADFVIRSSGQMRALSGRAYVPQLVPAGLAVEELE